MNNRLENEIANLKKEMDANGVPASKMNMVKMAEMLCAKFYHEMSGPITAIDNAVEFLDDSNVQMRAKALDLVQSSSKQAVSRLVFFRKAYGLIKLQGEANFEELQRLSSDFLLAMKIDIDWDAAGLNASDMRFTNFHAKILMNLLIVLSGAMVFGGKISVWAKKDEGKKRKMHIKCFSENQIIMNENTRDLIECGVENYVVDTKNVHIFYMLTICKEIDAIIKVERFEKQELEFTISY